MSDYRLQISKEGASVGTAGARDLIMDSNAFMLKYHSVNLGTVVFNPGDTEQSINFAHGLDYTPAFIAYTQHSLEGSTIERFIPSFPVGIEFTSYPYAYANGTNVTCGIAYDTGAYNQNSSGTPDKYNDLTGDTSEFIVGSVLGVSHGGALRFTNVTIPQGANVGSAQLSIAIDENGSGTGNINFNCWGIDEDNTADFSSNPMGRTKTSGTTNSQGPVPEPPSTWAMDVTTIVQEIVNRAGWTSANALGFIMENNGGAGTSVYIADQGGGNDSTLTVNYGVAGTVKFRAVIFKDKIA